jgi:hypothetical protein
VALETVFDQRLPGRSEVKVLVPLWPDTGIPIEAAKAHGDLLIGAGVTAEERRATGRAEELGHARGGLEGAQMILSLQ